MTYLQLVNKVLVRLRESEVSSVSQSSYSKLVGELINQTKREVEDARNWLQLRTTIQAATESGTIRYTLTGAGNRFRLLSAFNDTSDQEMSLIPSKQMTQLYTGGVANTGSPLQFDFNGQIDGDVNVDVYPEPNGVYNLNFDLVVPQDDLINNEDVLSTPEYPTILGAYAKAAAERGEDGGFMFAEAESNYQKALADAISIDASYNATELYWGVV